MTADGRRGLFGEFTVHRRGRHWTHRRCDGEDDTTFLVVRLEAFPRHKLDRGIFLLLLHSSLNMKLEGWLVAWCLCGGGVVVVLLLVQADTDVVAVSLRETRHISSLIH